jgi:hypothetical protein
VVVDERRWKTTDSPGRLRQVARQSASGPETFYSMGAPVSRPDNAPAKGVHTPAIRRPRRRWSRIGGAAWAPSDDVRMPVKNTDGCREHDSIVFAIEQGGSTASPVTILVRQLGLPCSVSHEYGAAAGGIDERQSDLFDVR